MAYAKQVLDPRSLVTNSKTTVTAISKKMKNEKVRNIFVIKGRKPIGIVRDVDIIYKVVAKGLNPKEVKAEQIMTTPAPVVDHKAGVVEVAKLMAEKGVRRVLLMEGDKIIGNVTAGEAIKILSHVPPGAVREAVEAMCAHKF